MSDGRNAVRASPEAVAGKSFGDCGSTNSWKTPCAPISVTKLVSASIISMGATNSIFNQSPFFSPVFPNCSDMFHVPFPVHSIKA